MSSRNGGKTHTRAPAILPQSTFAAGQQSEGLRRALAREEAILVRRPVEGGVMLSPEGQVLARFRTTTDAPLALRIAERPTDEYVGATFTHNHPHRSTFSPGDITMAADLRLHEVRAVTDRYVYRLIMPPYNLRADGIDGREMRTQLGYIDAYMSQQLFMWQYDHPGENPSAYRHYLERDKMHEMLSKLLPEYDITYVREPRHKTT